ncbi:acyl-CoA thioesterase [Vagococcus zengguangii]|uniref:Acyl-CoA thioesterase n=1 Tax=Vagococcus zengguangii TaxID=2571750 RepID=A0A4D7CUI0_9ENTE|nr:acyl-CoA thioesterase [Vagococcus zengguangii]QCI86894.1 acyl-CoA thioesterase [Vagococcus zengguangii]TLG80500.1 acyl-CoA thioesterase [Vagococcus zengguangii]
MNEVKPNQKFCHESRTVQTHLVLPQDTNSHNTLYGGQLMYYIDSCAAMAAIRHTRQPVVTASTDRLNFLAPIPADYALTLDAFVTGTGTRSLEVFVKVTGENLTTGERYLAATCFMTFVVVGKEIDKGYVVPTVVPESTEEISISKDYSERKQNRLRDLKLEKTFAADISLTTF